MPRFEVIGLSYLLSLDVSFGVWFFAFLATMHTGFERMLGWSIGPGQPYSMPASASVAHLAQGAMFFLVFSSLWAARRHVVHVLRKAFGKGDIDDSGELVSYRTAVFGFLAASIFCVIWLIDNGLGPGSAIFYYLLCIVTFVGLARIVSQAGLAYGVSPVAPPRLYRDSAGAERPNGAGHELPLVGRFAHFRDGVGGYGTKDCRGDAAGEPATLCGDCSGHTRDAGLGDLDRDDLVL